jgi:hypothetical protein
MALLDGMNKKTNFKMVFSCSNNFYLFTRSYRLHLYVYSFSRIYVLLKIYIYITILNQVASPNNIF